MYNFDYIKALYRRNNFGQPTVWTIENKGKYAKIYHGILGKTITEEIITADRPITEVIKSRIAAKRKVGYKHLSELKDNVTLPVEEKLIDYLNNYLSDYRTSADGSLLPMKAKVYDNTNNRIFKKVSSYIGQWKINGLRCFISATVNSGDMFHPTKLIFQSQEGTYWNSLTYLEDYLLTVIPQSLLAKMIDEHYILDGEVYIPGKTVNEINHAVKDANCEENKYVQFWCYDIAIDDTIQSSRTDIIFKYLGNYVTLFRDKNHHLNNTTRLVVLPNIQISTGIEALNARDKFIDLGFEGLILRNPDCEYQFGKRNMSMIKYKRSTDGKFKILRIYPENNRSNLPLFLCQNDINNGTFEVHLSAPHKYQEEVLINKDKYIGKYMFVEYCERSGVNSLPFHVKKTSIII